MTNQFYSKNAPINIYIANLDECDNEIGVCLSLTYKDNKFVEFLATIGNHKAYAIRGYANNSDIDDMEIGDGMSIEEIKIVCKRIGKLNTEELYILNALYEALEDIEKALDCYESDKYVYYGCITMKEVAQEFLNGAHTIPSYFKKHIDYKSIARDMLNNGYYITAYGVIEIL